MNTIAIIAVVAAFFYLIVIIFFIIEVRNACEDRDEELLHPGWDDENTHAYKENDEENDER
jgi:hypothetical protein